MGIMPVLLPRKNKNRMAEQPLISVIVTNYNHAQYIEQAVKSIEEQTYPNLEMIIVDDCSTDDSELKLKGFEGSGHKVIRLPENRGKWFALNTAIGQAKGKLITLQDADDASTSDRLDLQYNTLKACNSFNNLSGFKHCYGQKDIDDHVDYKFPESTIPPIMLHDDVTQHVLKGWKQPGINHFYLGEYEAHGATCLFYKQHWDFGMKFLPGNMGLRCQLAEDSDFNTKMTLLLQRTSITMVPLYCYRRNTSTNDAYKEEL